MVTLASTATFAVAGDAETFSGQLEPGQAGEVVSLQRRVGPRWVTVARPKLKRGDASRLRTRSRPAAPSSGARWSRRPSATSRRASPTVKIKIAPLTGIHKIKHVVIIMQENRSFDSYFGTYPGADGIPPGVCVPDPVERRVRGAVPRPLGPQLRRPALGEQRGRRHRQRPHGRVRRPGRAGMNCSSRGPELQPVHRHQPFDEQPAVVRRRDGLPRRARDPQLLDLRRELRAPGPHVRAQRLLEPPRPPVHGLRVVGVLYEPDGPVVVPRRRPEPECRLDAHQLGSSPNNGQLLYAWTDITYLLHQPERPAGPTTCSRAPSPTARTTPR